MKGKVGLVLGFAAGYVLGSRAGKERYRQIQQVASKVWRSGPVQSVAQRVEGAAREQVQTAQNFVIVKSKSLLHAATAPKNSEDGAARDAAARGGSRS